MQLMYLPSADAATRHNRASVLNITGTSDKLNVIHKFLYPSPTDRELHQTVAHHILALAYGCSRKFGNQLILELGKLHQGLAVVSY